MHALTANSIFSGPITHLLSVLYGLIKFLSHVDAKKKTKRLKGFRLDAFTGRFEMTAWQ